MKAEPLKVYVQNHQTSYFNAFAAAVSFALAKFHFYGAPKTVFGGSYSLAACVIMAAVAACALFNERRLFRKALLPAHPGWNDEASKLTRALALNKIFYIVPWMAFLYMPLAHAGMQQHLIGYFFAFCAIAYYGSLSAVFYPLFVWDVVLQLSLAGLMVWADRSAPVAAYFGIGIAVFGAYTLVIGHKISSMTAAFISNHHALETSAARAKKTERLKTDFLAVVSHEIRTPMMGILGMVDFLRGTSMNAEQKSYLETIAECSGTLLNTLNDVVDISREESGSLVIHRANFNPRDTMEGAVASMQRVATKKNLQLFAEITPDVPRQMYGDRHRLQQAIFNLLSNAIKFTEKGHVELKAVLAGEDMIVTVSDTGIGIDNEKIAALFKKFSQTGSSIAQEYGGAGLGLAITKKIVELMDGKIGVRSEKGKGSAFWFKIPCLPPVEETVAAQTADADINALDILLVEDNQVNQMIVTRFLEKKGHRVALASSGDQALTLLREKKYDLVLMDTVLPGKSGIETAAEISSMSGSKAPPIIAMTANASDAHFRKCIDAGIVDRIIKPFMSEQLYQVISKHVGSLHRQESAFLPEDAAPNPKLRQLEKELSHDYMLHVIDSSLKEMHSLIQRAKDARAKGDIPALLDIVHDIKSVSGYIGLDETSALAGSIENIDPAVSASSLMPTVDTLLKTALTQMTELQKKVNI